jgi:alpha-L-arabinofuranosidase
MFQLQVVSIALVPHNVTVALQGLPAGASAAGGELTVLTGPRPLAENSFEQPLNVRRIIMRTGLQCDIGALSPAPIDAKAGGGLQAAADVMQVAPRQQTLQSISGDRIQLQLPPLSLSVLVIDVSTADSRQPSRRLPRLQRTTV